VNKYIFFLCVQDGRIGAGCTGLSCGVQLGNLVLATPQLLGLGPSFRDRVEKEANNSTANRLVAFWSQGQINDSRKK